MIISDFTLKEILDLAKKNTNEAIEYMDKHQIQPNAYLYVQELELRIYLLAQLIQDDLYDMVTFILENNPGLISPDRDLPSAIPSNDLINSIVAMQPTNKDMLELLLKHGLSGKCMFDLHFGFGPIEIWQHFALTGEYESLAVILNSLQYIDVNKKINGFTIFELFRSKSDKVNDFFEKIKLNFHADIQGINLMLPQMLACICDVVPQLSFSQVEDFFDENDNLLDLAKNFPAFKEFIKETIRKAQEENELSSLTKLETMSLNMYLGKIDSLEHVLTIKSNQGKLFFNREIVPSLQTCLDMLKTYRAQNTTAIFPSNNRNNLFNTGESILNDEPSIGLSSLEFLNL